jgi:polygalacturonase
MVSITDFGAVGDGVHDDTTAIQATIDSGARIIFFPVPEVTYRITDSLTMGV